MDLRIFSFSLPYIPWWTNVPHLVSLSHSTSSLILFRVNQILGFIDDTCKSDAIFRLHINLPILCSFLSLFSSAHEHTHTHTGVHSLKSLFGKKLSYNQCTRDSSSSRFSISSLARLLAGFYTFSWKRLSDLGLIDLYSCARVYGFSPIFNLANCGLLKPHYRLCSSE